MTSSQYKVYFVLLFLAISSWFLADMFEEKDAEKVEAKDHSPDYFSTGYSKKEMTESGLIKSELIADRMIHYSDDETTHLEKPVMTLYNLDDIPPWIIKSDTAILEADGDNLQMLGNVFVNRVGTEDLRSFKLTTSKMNVKLSTDYAETDQSAEIIDAQNKTKGIGLEMTFKKPVRIKFLSNVKGRYVFN